MIDFFDKGLHYLGKANQKVFTINIGSMDGVLYDELCGYTQMYDFKGLYVEPIPYLFKRLKQNMNKDGNLFEMSAISDYDGEIDMIMIDQEAIDNSLVHKCFYGMSAVYPPKNGLGSEGDKEVVEKYSQLIKVPCITFETLLKKHSISNFDVVKMDTEGHDYKIFKQIDLKKYKPKIVRLEWINLTKEEQDNAIKILEEDYVYQISVQDITAILKTFNDEMTNAEKIEEKNNTLKTRVTLVTGLWDIGRSNLETGWSRKYQDYLDNFSKLLDVTENMIIFGDKELEQFVSTKRNESNTQFIIRDTNWFKNNEYYDLIQKIRTDPAWYNQVGWLQGSTQARLDMYNPLVMSKMFILNDAQIFDKFNSDYLFWIDAGLTFTVHPGYFTHDKVLAKLPKYMPKFTFITFPYETTLEIHGFEFGKICEFANEKVNKVARGGFFGGPKNIISSLNSIYYGLLMDTLSSGYMGTEESLFSIMLYRYSETINYIEIEENGLLCRFFEDLKNDTIVVKSFNLNEPIYVPRSNDIKTHLYVLTYNFPEQLEKTLESFMASDKNFLEKPQKFLINNSTDRTTDEAYDQICKKYDFTEIKKDNIGICGGRQFVADHFKESDADYYIFFEDDMMLYEQCNDFCNAGFRKWVPDLYNKTIKIMQKENYDYLKLNFTEVYGANDVQWAWYNVPDAVRAKYFPNKIKKPIAGLDPNPPKTLFTTVNRYEDITYIEGEIYYCNWPLWFNRAGNEKVFYNPKYDHPFEQTWMSQVFQKHKEGLFKTAVLLMSPINHNRLHFYGPGARKEN